ncbi:MAG: hypothetical protein GY862_03140 [Gammaproteobacteria bacterium]|nr:hypothetical protein [Gammaproteobacteria bacterium]
MLKTVEAIIEKNGAVRLLESVYPAQAMRALLTLVEPADNLPQKPLHGKQEKQSVWQALQAFRANADLEALDIDTRIFDSDRKQQKEREVEL